MKTTIDRSKGSSANAGEPRNFNAKKSLIPTRSKSESQAQKNLAIIDSKVENYQQLVRGIKPGTEVFVLDRTQDGIKQITEILSDRTDIHSLHIISHGKVAGLEIGSTALNPDNIESYSSQLKQWGKALSQTGNILIYGCNVAAGKSGKEFTDQISEITGKNLAASSNITGSTKLGGNWQLEVTTGQINVELAFKPEVLATYNYVLGILVTESFQNPTALGPWIYGTSGGAIQPGLTSGSGPGIIPSLGLGDPPGGGALRLTSNADNQAAFVIYNNAIPSGDGLRVIFDLFAYNSNSFGADGISFFLMMELPRQLKQEDSEALSVTHLIIILAYPELLAVI
ncbi:MAG: DUF4347 domain-containing protein [Oscillatoriales cyanobacterium RU_3_3]|nr:DUF4347 domain-containing protein [Oscillatoriales cyanobacterium RU_3_3]